MDPAHTLDPTAHPGAAPGHPVLRHRARAFRRAALRAVATLGAGGASWALASRELTDFLGEGPVRALSLSGRSQQLLIAAGTALGVGGAVALATWRHGRRHWVGGGVALLVALLLAPPLLIPVSALYLAAAAADALANAPDGRLAALVPARHPRAWLAGAAAAGAALAAVALLGVWLLRPIFDQGRALDEQLDFAVATTEPAGSVMGSPPPAGTAAAGAVLARGRLQGADSFHFGSGAVLLLRAPDGRLLLRFEDYAVRNGPDLFVYLTPDPAGDPSAAGALNLGAVRATSGNVNYELPADADHARFRSAVIWCRSFDVTFAVARFE